MKYLLFFSCFVLFNSCCNPNSKKDSINLKHEIIAMSDSFVIGVPVKLTCFDNDLIILDYKSDSIFHWIKLPDCKYLGRFGTCGQGPNEFLKVRSLHMVYDKFYAYDMYKSKLVQIIPDDTSKRLLFKESLSLPKGWIVDLLPLRNGLYCSTGCFEKGMFHLIDTVGNIRQITENFPARDDTESQLSNQVRFMAYQGCMDTDGKGHIVYLTAESKQRYIYKVGKDSLSKVAAFQETFPQYKPDTGDGFSVSQSADSPTGYRDVIACENRFYGLYSGRSFKENGLKCFECSLLYAYNWKGELIETYQLDIPVTNICLDKQRNTFYAIANIPDPALVRFIMPQAY